MSTPSLNAALDVVLTVDPRGGPPGAKRASLRSRLRHEA
jgi:hypothetical protein